MHELTPGRSNTVACFFSTLLSLYLVLLSISYKYVILFLILLPICLSQVYNLRYTLGKAAFVFLRGWTLKLIEGQVLLYFLTLCVVILYLYPIFRSVLNSIRYVYMVHSFTCLISLFINYWSMSTYHYFYSCITPVGFSRLVFLTDFLLRLF